MCELGNLENYTESQSQMPTLSEIFFAIVSILNKEKTKEKEIQI